MSAKKPSTRSVSTDPDDAPELTAEFFKRADVYDGEQLVRRGRPTGSTKPDAKQAVTVRYSPEVLAAFKASGAGWQARMNDALRDWLRSHSPVQ